MGAMFWIGNKSEVYPDRAICAVTGGGAYGPGSVSKMIGLDRWSRMSVDEDQRSGSRRSGAVVFGLRGDGVYSFSGVAASNRSEESGYFEVAGDKIVELNKVQVSKAAKRLFAEEFAKKSAEEFAIAERKKAEALAREQAIASANAATYGDDEDLAIKIAEDDESVTRIFPTRVVGAVLTLASAYWPVESKVSKLSGHSAWSEMKLIGSNVANKTWVLTGDGVYSFKLAIQREDKEPEERNGYFEVVGDVVSFVDSERVNTYRDVNFAAEAKAIVEQAASLPTLKGTPKQVAWALRLRAVLASREPGNVLLKKATTAKYWIESRFELKLQ